MSKFNPDFWEVVVERASLETFANEESLWQKYSESSPQHMRHTQEVFRQVLKLIRTELTPRQREVVQLYYFAGRTEVQIAAQLDIPQQVVSQHLDGVMRSGKKVGGAIPKLKKLCRKRGIDW